MRDAGRGKEDVVAGAEVVDSEDGARPVAFFAGHRPLVVVAQQQPALHVTAHAAITPSVAPPEPIITCMPVLVSRADMMAPATSPSEISLIRAPTSRTWRIVSWLRSRSRMTTTRSRGWRPSALAIRRKF